MAEARLNHLKALLGGQLPPREDQQLTPTGTSSSSAAAPTEPKVEALNWDNVTPFDALTTVDDFLAQADPHIVQDASHVVEDAPRAANRHRSNAPKLARGPMTEPIRPVFTPKASTSVDVNPVANLRQGEPAPTGGSFCPLLAVTKFPYRFVGSQYKQPIASAFFDGEKIWNREWGLYYIWSNESPTARPVTFITVAQFQTLIDEINSAFPELRWQIEQNNRDDGLVIQFDEADSNLKPRWLGRSNSRIQHDSLRDGISNPNSATQGVAGRSLNAFRDKVELANAAGRNKGKAAKTRRREGVVVQRQEMTKQVLRAQRYLGLAAGNDDPAAPDRSALSAQPMSVEKPPPHPSDTDVVFISIDVESWEMDHSRVTEVGVATLDTRDLRGKHPGRVGEHWQKAIRARHFRVAENTHISNHEFIHGCPENFEFGQSEVVSLKNLPTLLTSCFHHPFSKQPSSAILPNDEKEAASSNGISPSNESKAEPSVNHPPEKRNIVLVGHDIGQDINYCHQIGFSVLNRSNLIETLDTAAMYRSYTRDPNPRALGNILYDFDLNGWYLHNAGNDAVYTLWAMLAICVQDAVHPGVERTEKGHEEAREKETEGLPEIAVDRTDEDSEDEVPLGGLHGGSTDSGHDGTDDNSAGFRFSASGLYTSGGAPLDV